MKRIVLTCWFTDSEEFIAKMAIKESLDCTIRKIIDPVEVLLTKKGSYMIAGDKYEFYGKEEEISKVIKFINDHDYDVDVDEDEDA